MTFSIKDLNPYTHPAGVELDHILHKRLLAQDDTGGIPPYSIDASLSSKIRAKLKSKYGHPIIVGRTRMSNRPFFARYDSDPSTATEVVAETEALAICRLALVLLKRD